MAKPERDYQLKHRRKLPKVNGKPRRSIISDYSILVAWASADLSEGQAATLLGVDRLEARKMFVDAQAYALNAWDEWRKENPITTK